MKTNSLCLLLRPAVSSSVVVLQAAIRSVLCVGLTAMISHTAVAQASANVVIVGTVEMGGSYGTTGVFYVTLPTSTSTGGAITRLTGLPAELSVSYPAYGGAFSVLRRPSDGTLFVGDGAAGGGTCHVHILRMAGPIVTSASKVVLGQAPPVAGQNRQVSGLALLPDGRVVVMAAGLYSGRTGLPPMAILDDRPTTPTLTPILFSARLQYPWSYALTVSPDGRTAYLTNSKPAFPTAFPTHLYAVDISTTAPVLPQLLYTWHDRFVTRLTTAPDGVLYAASLDPRGGGAAYPSIEKIGRNGFGMVTSTTVSTNTPLIGPALVRDTGQFVFVSADFLNGVNPTSVLLSDRSGKLSLLASAPSGGWGLPVSLDISNAFDTYGAGTNGANSYAFAEWPNPGGSPDVGNASFSLTVESSPGAPTNSFMVLGLARTDRPLLGIRLLVDLAMPHVLFPMSAAKSAVFPLPIPNVAALRGTTLHAQSAHADAGAALASSNGLSIYIR